jgi:ribonuclease P protein component
MKETTLSARFGPGRRLRKHAEFARAQRSGRRVGTPHFALLVAARGQPGAARLGLVVGRKVGTAVQRNRIKRLCRECFRRWPDLLPEGVDLIVIAREGAHELGQDEVRAEWRAVAGLLKKRATEALASQRGSHHPTRHEDERRPGAAPGAPSPPPPRRPNADSKTES